MLGYYRQQWDMSARYGWIVFAFLGTVALVNAVTEYRDVEHLQARALPMTAVVQSTTGLREGDVVVRGVQPPQAVCTAHYQKRPPPAVGEVITVLYDRDAPARCDWRSMPQDSEYAFPFGAAALFWLLALIGMVVGLVLRREDRMTFGHDDPPWPTVTP